MSATPVLVLFDVDGTLLVTGGATTRCIHRAMAAVAGKTCDAARITVGSLDSQIYFELARQYGIDDAAQKFARYKDLYLAELHDELERVTGDVRTLPGVTTLLIRLRSRNDVVIGVLTGNFAPAARLKLQAAGLSPSMFAVSAFAEDGDERSDLVSAALSRFRKHLTQNPDHIESAQSISPAAVVIVGDTPRDIRCARDAGCRVLAVATGYYSIDELRDQAPDRLAADLTDPRPLEELITESLQ